MKFETVDITKIVEGERIRQEYGDLTPLIEDIEKNGLIQPLAVTPQGEDTFLLLAGGRRLRALQQSGATEVPIRIYDKEMSELERKSIEYSENFHRLDMTWDEQVKLASEIDQLHQQIYGAPVRGNAAVGWQQKDTAKLLGVSKETVSKDLTLAKALSEFPELFSKCKTKSDAMKMVKTAGKVAKNVIAVEEFDKSVPTSSMAQRQNLLDSYIVGSFFDHAPKLLNESVDLVEADPPYAIDYKVNAKSYEANYGGYHEIKSTEYPNFVRSFVKECFRILRPGGWIIVWHRHEWSGVIREILKEVGFNVSPTPGIWAKTYGATNLPQTRLASCYESFFYACKGEGSIVAQGRSNIFNFQPLPPSRKGHPTERPQDLIEEILSTFVEENSTILCPFLGSGNTILAARACKMNCYGYEIEPSFKDSYIIKVHNL